MALTGDSVKKDTRKRRKINSKNQNFKLIQFLRTVAAELWRVFSHVVQNIFLSLKKLKSAKKRRLYHRKMKKNEEDSEFARSLDYEEADHTRSTIVENGDCGASIRENFLIARSEVQIYNVDGTEQDDFICHTLEPKLSLDGNADITESNAKNDIAGDSEQERNEDTNECLNSGANFVERCCDNEFIFDDFYFEDSYGIHSSELLLNNYLPQSLTVKTPLSPVSQIRDTEQNQRCKSRTSLLRAVSNTGSLISSSSRISTSSVVRSDVLEKCSVFNPDFYRLAPKECSSMYLDTVKDDECETLEGSNNGVNLEDGKEPADDDAINICDITDRNMNLFNFSNSIFDTSIAIETGCAE